MDENTKEHSPDEVSKSSNSLQIILPTVQCSDTSLSLDNEETERTVKPFISSESKLSLPSNLGTPTSPMRLSSPLSLPASPSPFVKISPSPQPPPSPKSPGRSRISSSSNAVQTDSSDISSPPANASSATGNPRNKCALQPGHSLMDWIRLGNSGKDLSGVGGRIRHVSPKELAAHNTKNDAWLAIRGRVYNITHYLPFHPGGPEELMRGAGIDATQLFDKVHPWVNFDSLLAKCLIGPLTIDRPDSDEVFGSPNSSALSKQDRLREPSKAQELVRKSMENLANCITPVRKKNTSKSDDNVRSSNPSKIMQSLIKSSDLPVSISRRAGSNSVRSNSSSSDDTPSPLRFDWIQTSKKLTVSIYTGPLSNPGGCARLTDGTLFVEIVTNGWLRTLKLVPEGKLVGPLQMKVFAESGKIEVTAHKAEQSVWRGCGETITSQASRMVSPRAMQCVIREKNILTHDTYVITLAPDAGPVLVPLGHHVKVHCMIKGSECIRSYTPVGDGWSASDTDGAACIKLAVKRYSNGLLSSHLTSLKVDDIISLSGPYGNFHLQQLKGISRIYFIAAGTGITPMLGLIKFMLTRSNPKCEYLHLLFFNKKEEDILFNENFEQIEDEDARFKVTHVLSEASSEWGGLKGRISIDLLSEIIKEEDMRCVDDCKHFVSLCGPTEFTTIGVELLIKMAMNDNCFHAFMG